MEKTAKETLEKVWNKTKQAAVATAVAVSSMVGTKAEAHTLAPSEDLPKDKVENTVHASSSLQVQDLSETNKAELSDEEIKQTLATKGMEVGSLLIALSPDGETLSIIDQEKNLNCTVSMDELRKLAKGKEEKEKYAPEVRIAQPRDPFLEYALGYADGNDIVLNANKFSDQNISDTKCVSIVTHEKAHALNHSKGMDAPIAPEYAMKLTMLNEISANLAQAGLAFNDYRTSGRLEAFDLCHHCGNEAVEKVKA